MIKRTREKKERLVHRWSKSASICERNIILNDFGGGSGGGGCGGVNISAR